MRLAVVIGAALTVLAGCASVPGGLTPIEPNCVSLFRNYDRAVLQFGYSDRVRDGRVSFLVPTAVGRAGQRLRQYDCLTTNEDIFRMTLLAPTLRGALVGESGAAIEPISLHVGIVPGITSEVQTRTFFNSLGIRTRSIGAPGLGRRIFLGPFATAGGLAEATDIALQAGFVAPYPRRF